MGMKDYARMMLPLLMLGMYEPSHSKMGNDYTPPTDEELARMRERAETRRKEILLRKGMKEFDIDGTKVLALNYKNAKRKYDNILKQIEHEQS